VRATYIETAADVAAGIKLGSTPESIVLDYKEHVHLKAHTGDGESPTKPQAIATDIVSFANAFGGTILVGVREGSVHLGVYKVAAGFANVPHVGDIQRWLDDSVRNHMHPRSVTFRSVPVPLPSGECLLSICVPPSANLCAVWSTGNSSIKFPYRTTHGNRYLHPSEVEARILNTARAAEIRLRSLAHTPNTKVVIASLVCKQGLESAQARSARLRKAQAERRPMDPHTAQPKVVYAPQTHVDAVLTSFDEHQFELSITGRPVSVPYGSVQEVWLGPQNVVQLVLRPQVMVPQNFSTPVWLDFVHRAFG